MSNDTEQNSPKTTEDGWVALTTPVPQKPATSTSFEQSINKAVASIDASPVTTVVPTEKDVKTVDVNVKLWKDIQECIPNSKIQPWSADEEVEIQRVAALVNAKTPLAFLQERADVMMCETRPFHIRVLANVTDFMGATPAERDLFQTVVIDKFKRMDVSRKFGEYFETVMKRQLVDQTKEINQTIKAESVEAESVKVEPIKLEPVKVKPVVAECVQVKSESVKVEPVEVNDPMTDQLVQYLNGLENSESLWNTRRWGKTLEMMPWLQCKKLFAHPELTTSGKYIVWRSVSFMDVEHSELCSTIESLSLDDNKKLAFYDLYEKRIAYESVSKSLDTVEQYESFAKTIQGRVRPLSLDNWSNMAKSLDSSIPSRVLLCLVDLSKVTKQELELAVWRSCLSDGDITNISSEAYTKMLKHANVLFEQRKKNDKSEFLVPRYNTTGMSDTELLQICGEPTWDKNNLDKTRRGIREHIASIKGKIQKISLQRWLSIFKRETWAKALVGLHFVDMANVTEIELLDALKVANHNSPLELNVVTFAKELVGLAPTNGVVQSEPKQESKPEPKQEPKQESKQESKPEPKQEAPPKMSLPPENVTFNNIQANTTFTVTYQTDSTAATVNIPNNSGKELLQAIVKHYNSSWTAPYDENRIFKTARQLYGKFPKMTVSQWWEVFTQECWEFVLVGFHFVEMTKDTKQLVVEKLSRIDTDIITILWNIYDKMMLSDADIRKLCRGDQNNSYNRDTAQIDKYVEGIQLKMPPLLLQRWADIFKKTNWEPAQIGIHFVNLVNASEDEIINAIDHCGCIISPGDSIILSYVKQIRMDQIKLTQPTNGPTLPVSSVSSEDELKKLCEMRFGIECCECCDTAVGKQAIREHAKKLEGKIKKMSLYDWASTFKKHNWANALVGLHFVDMTNVTELSLVAALALASNGYVFKEGGWDNLVLFAKEICGLSISVSSEDELKKLCEMCFDIDRYTSAGQQVIREHAKKLEGKINKMSLYDWASTFEKYDWSNALVGLHFVDMTMETESSLMAALKSANGGIFLSTRNWNTLVSFAKEICGMSKTPLKTPTVDTKPLQTIDTIVTVTSTPTNTDAKHSTPLTDCADIMKLVQQAPVALDWSNESINRLEDWAHSIRKRLSNQCLDVTDISKMIDNHCGHSIVLWNLVDTDHCKMSDLKTAIDQLKECAKFKSYAWENVVKRKKGQFGKYSLHDWKKHCEFLITTLTQDEINAYDAICQYMACIYKLPVKATQYLNCLTKYPITLDVWTAIQLPYFIQWEQSDYPIVKDIVLLCRKRNFPRLFERITTISHQKMFSDEQLNKLRYHFVMDEPNMPVRQRITSKLKKWWMSAKLKCKRVQSS
jgi:hypothetical protein